MELETKEVWRDVPDFNGVYQVSNLGRVRSVNRIIRQKNGRRKTVIGRVLHQWKNHQGYWEVTLCKDYKRKQCRVNRLVAMCFLDNPDNLPEVNHKDERKENNAVWNLEYMSHYDNIRYSANLHKNDPNYKKHKKKNNEMIGECSNG